MTFTKEQGYFLSETQIAYPCGVQEKHICLFHGNNTEHIIITSILRYFSPHVALQTHSWLQTERSFAAWTRVPGIVEQYWFQCTDREMNTYSFSNKEILQCLPTLIHWLYIFNVPDRRYFVYRNYHLCRWRTAICRSMLGAFPLWIWSNLYRAIPAVTRYLTFVIHRTKLIII